MLELIFYEYNFKDWYYDYYHYRLSYYIIMDYFEIGDE